jgi:hypothetical protein
LLQVVQRYKELFFDSIHACEQKHL